MFIEVVFDKPVAVDEAALELSTDGRGIGVELDWWDASGQAWSSRDARERELAPPIGLRREAAEVVKERGIGYMVVHDDDFGAKDFAEKQDQWGIRLRGNRGAFRLYEIR
jgi:hypothetical protein